MHIIDNMATDDYIIICEKCIDAKTQNKSIEPMDNENGFFGSVINYVASYLSHRKPSNSSAV